MSSLSLNRAMDADDGLLDCVNRWSQGSRDRIISFLVTLARHFGVEHEVAQDLVNATPTTMPTPKPTPLDAHVVNAMSTPIMMPNAQDFAENVDHSPPPYESPHQWKKRERQADYWDAEYWADHLKTTLGQ